MSKQCMLFHKFKVVKSTSKTKYLECSKCGKRKIEIKNGGYQPIGQLPATLKGSGL